MEFRPTCVLASTKSGTHFQRMLGWRGMVNLLDANNPYFALCGCLLQSPETQPRLGLPLCENTQVKSQGSGDSMNPETFVVIPEQVLSNNLGDETVLLNLQTGIYYGLDPVGSRIWALIQKHGKLGTLHALLLDQYEATSEQIWTDLVALLGQMRQKGLVECQSVVEA